MATSPTPTTEEAKKQMERKISEKFLWKQVRFYTIFTRAHAAAAGPAVNLRIAQQKRFDRNGDEC